MNMTLPSVYIIVLTWNDCQLTAACLRSLLDITYANTSIIVVDNGSRPEFPAALEQDFPNIPIVRTGRNLGFSGGNNVGIQLAFDRGADYVLILNNDTIVSPDFLTLLITYMQAHPNVGMATPKIFFQMLPDEIWAAGVDIRLSRQGYLPVKLSRGLSTLLFKLRGYHQVDVGQFENTELVSGAPGCACLVSRTVLEQVGFLDEDFFLLHEDSDWSYRTCKAGFDIAMVPQSIIWHRVAASSGTAYSPSGVYYAHRNALYFVRKHTSNLTKVWFYLLGLGTFLKDSILLSLGRPDAPFARAKVQAFVDFVHDRRGQRRD